MAGDWTKRFTAGDAWRPRSEWLNNVTRTAEDHLRSLASQGAQNSFDPPPEGLVLIKNGSAADVLRFAILGLNGIVIDPNDNLSQFQAAPVFFGDVPNTGDTFVICAEPIAKGKCGMAFIFGVCAVQIDIVSTDDEFADLIDSDSSKLRSGPAGPMKILYSEAGIGTKWAVVLFAPSGGGSSLVPIFQGQFLGAVADNTIAASFPFFTDP
jgi:hypothetical protein